MQNFTNEWQQRWRKEAQKTEMEKIVQDSLNNINSQSVNDEESKERERKKY